MMMNIQIILLLLILISLLLIAYIFFSLILKFTKAIEMYPHLRRGGFIVHFSTRFFSLLDDISMNSGANSIIDFFGDDTLPQRKWTHSYWSLVATEFYFYHHKLLPTQLFSLWMVDLARLYSSSNGEVIRETHIKYLNTYKYGYEEMATFFEDIYRLSKKAKGMQNEDANRSKLIVDFVNDWIAQNQKYLD